LITQIKSDFTDFYKVKLF